MDESYCDLPLVCYSSPLCLPDFGKGLGACQIIPVSESLLILHSSAMDLSPADLQKFCLASSLVAQTVKSLPAVWGTGVQSLGWEETLEKEMATYSSIVAWKIPGTEEPAGYSPCSLKESGMTEQLTHTARSSSNLISFTNMF